MAVKTTTSGGVVGQVPMEQKFRRIVKALPEETRRALLEDTEIDATECRKRVPVRFGNLKGTIHVEDQSKGNQAKVAIVAGGPAAPYAVYVHEDLEAFHPNGEAKFIESVIKESAPHKLQRVAARIDLSKLG